jgi:hypothetical protein
VAKKIEDSLRRWVPMNITTSRHSVEILDMVVEKGLVTTRIFRPEWNNRIQIGISDFRQSLDFLSAGTIDELPVSVHERMRSCRGKM